MKNKPRIAVLGGDLRQVAVAKELAKKEVGVYASGLCAELEAGSEIKECDDIAETVATSDAVILPLPAGMDGNVLNCPTLKMSERVPLEYIVEHMNDKAILFGGRIPENTVVKAQGRGIKVYDYFLWEKLQIKNAYITAEAALSIAMNSLDKCVKDAKFAVTGSGRISRLLCELLRRLGSEVIVAARNPDSLVYFELLGCDTVQIINGKHKWYEKFEKNCDIIFNTVPAWLFDREFLENADKSLMIIELASAPGGVDICAARELSTNVLWASSLPGKYAPYSAGKLIAECILEKLCDKEVGIL